MNAERMALLVATWVRCYTRRLPTSAARQRLDEVTADLHDHIACERSVGASEAAIARRLASRALRGVVADVSWRHQQARAARATTRRSTTRRSIRRVAVGVGSVLLLPLITTLTTSGEGWQVGDFVLAAVLLSILGASIECARHRSGSLVNAFVIASLGVVAVLFGDADDAPGMVVLGLLLVVSGAVLGLRRERRGTI